MICDESLALRNRFPFLPIQPIAQQLNAAYCTNAFVVSYKIDIPDGAILMRLASATNAICFYAFEENKALTSRTDDYESNGTACTRIKSYAFTLGSKRTKVARIGTNWIPVKRRRVVFVGTQLAGSVVSAEFIIKKERD